MGQKTNPIIFKLGIKNNIEWESKYFEKNKEEASNYIYNDIEIRKFLERFLKINGIMLHNVKLKYNEKTLNIFLSYYIKPEAANIIHNINNTNIVLTKIKKVKNTHYNKRTLIKKRLFIINKIQHIIQKKIKIKKIFIFNNFSEYILESLSIFTKKKLNINIITQNLNKGLSLNLKNDQYEAFKKLLIELRKYTRAPFYKEAINILLITIIKKNSSKFFCDYIAQQLTFLKKHNFFIKFIKKSLEILLESELHNIKGIKIEIKGRIKERFQGLNYKGLRHSNSM